MLANLNVRSYDLNEEMFNTCVVPNCVVSRNTLAKWRLVAIDRFGFPRQLAVTLHPCPDEERDKWMAEIDLDPNFKVIATLILNLDNNIILGFLNLFKSKLLKSKTASIVSNTLKFVIKNTFTLLFYVL